MPIGRVGLKTTRTGNELVKEQVNSLQKLHCFHIKWKVKSSAQIIPKMK